MIVDTPSNIFYSAIVGEFLRIGRSTLKLEDFIPKAKELLMRMKNQGSEINRTKRALRKIINSHPTAFEQFGVDQEWLINEVTK